MAKRIDTAHATDRRPLRFERIDDVLADIDRVVAADEAGTLRRSGNWSAGQTFGHLAGWINYGYEGFPMRVPWFIRLILRMKVKKYLREGLPAGTHIPKVPGGTYATEELDTATGAERLRAALERLKTEPARYHSPAFGPMREEDRITGHLRHAELHLSFLHPE